MGSCGPPWTALLVLAACAGGDDTSDASRDTGDDTDAPLADTGERPPRGTCHDLVPPLEGACEWFGGRFCTLGETLTGGDHQDHWGARPPLAAFMPAEAPHPLGLPLHDARYAGCTVERTSDGDRPREPATFTYDAGGTQVEVWSRDWTIRSHRTLDRSCRIARIVEEEVPPTWPGSWALPVPVLRVFRFDEEDRLAERSRDTGTDSEPDSADTAVAFAYEDLDDDGLVDRIGQHARGFGYAVRWRLRWADGELVQWKERWFGDTGSDTAVVYEEVHTVERDASGRVLAWDVPYGRTEVRWGDDGRVVGFVSGDDAEQLTWDGDVVVAVVEGPASCLLGPAEDVPGCARSEQRFAYDEAGRLASVRVAYPQADGDTDGGVTTTTTFAYQCGP